MSSPVPAAVEILAPATRQHVRPVGERGRRRAAVAGYHRLRPRDLGSPGRRIKCRCWPAEGGDHPREQELIRRRETPPGSIPFNSTVVAAYLRNGRRSGDPAIVPMIAPGWKRPRGRRRKRPGDIIPVLRRREDYSHGSALGEVFRPAARGPANQPFSAGIAETGSGCRATRLGFISAGMVVRP